MKYFDNKIKEKMNLEKVENYWQEVYKTTN